MFPSFTWQGHATYSVAVFVEALEAEVDKPSGSGFCCVSLNSGERIADCFSPVIFAAPTESLGSHNKGEPSPTKLP